MLRKIIAEADLPRTGTMKVDLRQTGPATDDLLRTRTAAGGLPTLGGRTCSVAACTASRLPLSWFVACRLMWSWFTAGRLSRRFCGACCLLRRFCAIGMPRRFCVARHFVRGLVLRFSFRKRDEGCHAFKVTWPVLIGIP